MAIPFAYIWGKIIAKLGPKKSLIRSCIWYGAVLLGFFPAKNCIQGIVVCLILSFGLAGIMVLLDIFIADVADEDEVKTGARREGMYFGVNGFMIRLGISVNAMIMGTVLDRSGYVPGLEVQTPAAITGLRVLMSFVPVCAMILALLILRHYPLDGEKLLEVRKGVARVRQEKRCMAR